MAKHEWMTRLRERIAELDMAIMTATVNELATLEKIRESLATQLEDPRARLKAA